MCNALCIKTGSEVHQRCSSLHCSIALKQFGVLCIRPFWSLVHQCSALVWNNALMQYEALQLMHQYEAVHIYCEYRHQCESLHWCISIKPCLEVIWSIALMHQYEAMHWGSMKQYINALESMKPCIDALESMKPCSVKPKLCHAWTNHLCSASDMTSKKSALFLIWHLKKYTQLLCFRYDISQKKQKI